MDTYTRADLIRAVLEELLVLGAGEDVPAEDSDAVDSVIDGVVADLNGRLVCLIPDVGDVGPVDGQIDAAQFRHLVQIVAAYAGPKFSKPFNAQMMALGESRLRTLARVGKGARGRLLFDPAFRRARRGTGSFTQGT